MDRARSEIDPGAPRRRPAPRLLLLVLGIFLMLVGLTGTALVAVTSEHVAGTTLRAIVERDRSLVDFFANATLTTTDLTRPLTDARRSSLIERIEALTASDAIRSFEVRAADGRLVVGTSGGTSSAPDETAVARALAGTAGAALVDSSAVPVVVEYLPLTAADGRVLGTVVMERDAQTVLASLDASRRDVLVVTIVAAVALAAVLTAVFRAAHVRIARQHHQLVESSRRDALTGMLNHGAIVAALVERVEAARADGGGTAVALVDVDNFRLFNDTHGHEAGDAVLLRVAGLVRDAAGADADAARYGPDEFLVVADDPQDLDERMHALQAQVRSLAIRVGTSEELPITVSVGIAAIPAHAAAVNPLLAEASVALTEAKASGGNVVLAARVGRERQHGFAGFDVLKSLIQAVDTKDRYTKRHSEDVARYAAYLAKRLDLHDLVEPVRLAGLLHDVGKIGIPDRLLRKPSRLTTAEIKVFNQHVALGDAIVRDVPHLEEVRAGIRHHHERWDGGGYLAGLGGEDIPLIARIIAVADTFSAMTTTRPYRKALSVDEALRRLREAAGTQLQPRLVDAFADGIETDPAAPRPDEGSSPWIPLRVA